MSASVRLAPLVLWLAACGPSPAPPDAERSRLTPPSVVNVPSAPSVAATASGAGSAAAPAPATSTNLVQEGTYWPFAKLPPRIGDIGQGSTTVFAAVPGGTCTHWNCSVTFSLAPGCHAFSLGDDACAFGVYQWQTVFGNDDPLAGPPVQLHHGVVGHRRREGAGGGGASISWPAASGGVNEVALRSGHEEHLVTLANALVDAGF
jgi:hypothetical protein